MNHTAHMLQINDSKAFIAQESLLTTFFIMLTIWLEKHAHQYKSDLKPLFSLIL